MQVSLSISTPYMSVMKFAQEVGTSESSVKRDLDRGYLPEYRHDGAPQGKGSTRYVDYTKVLLLRLRQSGATFQLASQS